MGYTETASGLGYEVENPVRLSSLTLHILECRLNSVNPTVDWTAVEPTPIREVKDMPRGSVPKREAKKPKKSAQKREAYTSPVVVSETVEVVGKRRRRREEAES